MHLTYASRPWALLLASVILASAQVEQRQTPSFRGAVSQVRVDIIVTDAAGRFVDDLSLRDFTISEDGNAQEILGLDLIVVDEGPASSERPLQGGAQGAADPRPASVESPGALIYVVDMPGLDWKSKARFTSAWASAMTGAENLTMPQAVYMIDQTGVLHELAPLSTDVARLTAAIEEVRATPLVRRGLHEQLVSGRDGELRANDLLERARSYESLERLTQFCLALRARRGRTALVWVTSELLMMEAGPFAALEAARTGERPISTPNPFAEGQSELAHVTPDPRIGELESALYAAANSANVSIYAIDPTPEAEWRSVANSAANNARLARLLNDPIVQGSLDGLRDVQRNASAATGGESFIGWTDLESVFPAIVQDTSRYYMLTYATPEPVGDGRYHDIAVEVLRPNVTVRARTGYVDLPAAVEDQATMAAVLALPGTASSLSLVATTLRRWTLEGAPVMQSIVGLSESGPSPFADRHDISLPVTVHVVALDDAGNVASRAERRLLPRDGGTGDARGVTARPFFYTHDWDLPTGHYDLRFAVREESSGRLGAIRVPLEVAETTDGWQTSDILLLAYSGQEVWPLASNVLVEGDSLAVQLEVYKGSGPVLSGIVFDAEGMSAVAELPSVAMVAQPGGIHRGMLRATGFAPGSYLVQVSVIDSATGNHRILRTELTVVAGNVR